MKLYLAGSFGGFDLKETVDAAGATDLLLSYGVTAARDESAPYFAKRGGYEVILYLAGVPGDCVGAQALLDEKGRNVLCSFPTAPSRRAAEYIAAKENDVKLFVAGDWGPERQPEVCEATGERNLLCTNAHAGAKACADQFATTRMDYHLLIDSGAFTAWKQGTPIKLEDYIAYALDLKAKANCTVEFIALDVIAGSYANIRKGIYPTQAEYEHACQQGFDNWQAMEAAGIPCIPTFHRGDDFKWLTRLAEAVKPGGRLCLAPKVDGSRPDVKMAWLNGCFILLTALNARLNLLQLVNLKVWERWLIHGLGISSQEMMEAYPFYSVDSTSWLWAAQNCTLRYFDGKRIKTLQSKQYLGGKFGVKEQEAAQHYAPPRNHHFDGNWEGMCQACGKPEEGHGEEKAESQGLSAGAYWFGKEAMKADVDLALHVTKVWQARGVFFDDEERLDVADFNTSDHWSLYVDTGSDESYQKENFHSAEDEGLISKREE